MKIGIKFASAKANSGIVMPAIGLVELFCIETGETIEGIRNVDVHYGVGDPISATVDLFPSQIVGTDGKLYETGQPVVGQFEIHDS